MAFLQDNIWVNIPSELAEYLEDFTQFWNSGRFNIHISATPPTSITPANGPELVVAKDGSTWKLYIYVNTTDKWQVTSLSTVA